METHPVPQQISSYQFRLVGDMTLKQFFQVGGGALISLLLYASGLHPFLKWPLILISFSLGAAMAFLPFEERPLSRWILAFFRSVYAPTIFNWEKLKDQNTFFQNEAPAPQIQGVVAPHGEVALEDYLKALPEEKAGSQSKLDRAEENFLTSIARLFGGGPRPQPPVQPALAVVQAIPATALPTATVSPPPFQSINVGFRPKIVVEEKVPTQTSAPSLYAKVSPTLTGNQVAGQQAEFSPEAAPPSPAYIPNTVVGQVMDANGKIIEGAILEIRDLAGRSVRALRSNKVGHFITVTALINGQYDIITEKDGYKFDPVTFETKGEIIPPIVIRAKEKTNVE